MLFHEENEIVQMLPPRDVTNGTYTCWVNMHEWHHGAFFCYVGRHRSNVTFAFRKGQSTQLIAGNETKNGHSRVAPLQIPRWWSNVNSDDTATTHFSLHPNRPSSDSTIGSTAITKFSGSGYSDIGGKGELYLVEVDSAMLGEDSLGRYYDMVQIVVTAAGSPPDPAGILGYGNHVAVWAILSQPRYGGRACTTNVDGMIPSRTP